MIIGVDIDGTMNDIHSIILEYGKIYNKQINGGIIKNENAYRINDIFNWNERDCKKFKWQIQNNVINYIKSRNNVSKVLKKLKQEGFKIYIVTGRKLTEMNHRDINTKKWLINNNIPYDKLIFEENDKGIACYKNDINIFIGDSIKHLNRISKYGIKCYLFDNVYNKKDSKYERVCTFNELYDKILNGGKL